MSKLENRLVEELIIRKAKYRVKNSEDKYEVVYLETSADQVEETSDRVFVTPAEKNQITSNKEAITAETQAREAAVNGLSGRLDVVEGDGEGSINKALQDAKTYTDTQISNVNSANEALNGKVQTLEEQAALVDGKVVALTEKVSANESAISDLRDAISNKNSNTIVVNTEDEIATANANPKVGDLAYVISSKRAYIYKGVDALSVKAVPQGWVVFDEITSELDLVDYLKKSEAEATYRKLADKIAEGDLATELATKINNKADKSYVDTQLAGKTNEAYVNSKVEEVVAPVRTESAQNKADIAKEVEDRKFEDIKLNHRISKFVPVVASEEPADTEAGHVWLEIQA